MPHVATLFLPFCKDSLSLISFEFEFEFLMLGHVYVIIIIFLCRCSKYESECAVAVNMMKHVNSTPKDISVRKKFWLNDRVRLVCVIFYLLIIFQIKPPYLAAIEQLKSLPRLHCPSLKLDCLVTLSKIIVQTIEDYYFTSPSSSFSSSSSSSDRGMTKEDIAV